MKKILIIGSKDHTKATCIEWLGKYPHIGDYDVLIVNLPSLNRDILMRLEDEDKIDALRNSISELVTTGREVYCILTDSIATPRRVKGGVSGHFIHSNYRFFPVTLEIEKIDSPAETITTIDKNFEFYMKHVKKWTFRIDAVETGGIGGVSALAVNKSGESIAQSVLFRTRLPDTCGKIYFLPPTTECNNFDSIELIKNEILDIKETEPPPWAKNIFVVNQKALIKEMINEDAIIDRSARRKNELIKKLDHLEYYKGLLFESGTKLEDIVKDTFSKEFGIPIKEGRPSREEFFILTKPPILVEVKGRDHQIKESDWSELLKYCEELADTHKKLKGLLIGNHYRKIEPNKRNDCFPRTVESFARIKGFCLVSTTSLFNMLNAFLAGKLKRRNIIELILRTNGELVYN